MGAPVEHGRRLFEWNDLAALALLLALIASVVTVAREWSGPLEPVAEIHLEAGYLPLYALFSLARGVIAYGISLLFTMVYGYVTARVTGAERVLLPVLDILQSIPVLGFLPGFVLAMVHLFPHRNIGLELAAVLMIFTGQVWNMTFSFYASLKSIPPDLMAVARLARMSWWQRFFRLDLSFAATGMVWNSMVSMAGGWFFLTVSEAFVLGDHDFRLPGLGSYMSLAIERGNVPAQLFGVLAMSALIVFLDQIVWRPMVAWAQKFTDEEVGPTARSWLWERVRRARLWKYPPRWARRLLRSLPHDLPAVAHRMRSERLRLLGKQLVAALLAAGILLGLIKYLHLLTSLKAGEWLDLLWNAAVTFSRVVAAVVVASLWTIPVGVWMGRDPRRARLCQPVIQMTASFPAPMVFPLVVGGMMALGVGLGVSSIGLLLLGTQWYVLFNVIAGTSAIPRELWEVSRLARLPLARRWRTIILPGIFPHLLTGWITAMGGAWNASIVAEYLKYRGQTLTTVGLGAAISQATEHGDFHVLAAAVGLMAVVVVGFNRLIWRPLSLLAQTRFNLPT